MHISENNRKEAKKHHINVVVAGHIASDSLGMNLFLDELQARGVEVISCSGLLRVEREGNTTSCG
jgi:putative NIF3 family GTP cyclohydrolase 1 type 2